jgi:hypothetical protein
VVAINAAIFDPRLATPLCDTNHDHVCDVSDLIGASRKIFGAPAYCGRFPPVSDLDGDGAADGQDPCPTTLAGAPQIAGGCSATDLALEPEALGGPVMEGLRERLASLGRSAILADLGPAVDRSNQAMAAALFDLKYGELCSGARSFEGAVAQLEQAAADGETALARFWEGMPVPEQTEDVDEHSSRYLAERLEFLELVKLGGQARLASEAFSRVCASHQGPEQVRGTVDSIDAHRRAIHLTSGQSIVMAAGAKFDDALAEGSEIAVEAERYGGSLLGKAQLDLASSSDPVLIHAHDQCLGLRIVPYQDWPSSPGSWTMHPVDGYRDAGGKVEVEKGMRLGAQGPTCPGVLADQGPYGADQKTEYRYELVLDYKVDGGGWTTATLASALGSGATIALPLDMDPGQSATLTARRIKRTCDEKVLTIIPDDWDCSGWAPIATEVLSLEVREKFGYCTAVYAQTTFDLGDASPQDWRPVQVTSAMPTIGPGSFTSSFSAMGNKLVNGVPAFSSSIGTSQSFAIYNPEPWSIYHGTDHPSGLLWPHVAGTRNGKPFRYACAVPELARDALDFCQGTETFYRLPFPSGQGTGVTQGNGGSFTHNGWQWFALDLSGSQFQPLVASRGGKVVDVVSDVTVNCPDDLINNIGCPFFGNYVAIEHQDGDVSWYLHMVHNSPAVSIGQQVQRGALIGLLGNTGNSTGPHVHFHVTPSLGAGSTVLARFQAYTFPLLQFATCFVPQQGLVYVSNNAP